MGEVGNGVNDLLGVGQQALVARLGEHQGIGQVVDVLGCAGEMDELAHCLQLGIAGDLLLEEILHRLHIVIGGALDVLHPLGVFQGEILHDAIEQAIGLVAEGRYLGNAVMQAQGLQPAYLHQHPVFDQAEFTEDGTQALGLAGIAAVDGRDGGKGCQIHGRFLPVINRQGAKDAKKNLFEPPRRQGRQEKSMYRSA